VQLLTGIDSIEYCERYFMYEPKGQAADGFTYFPKNGICRLFQFTRNGILEDMKSFQDSDRLKNKMKNNPQYFRKFDTLVYTVFRKRVY
jgi:hypothetical protein